MYKATALDREILRLEKKVSPLGMFASGLKQYAGKVWLPTKENEQKALEQVDKLLRKAKNDPVARKYLRAARRGLLFEELHDYPGSVMNYLYEHFLIEGFNQAHISKLADGCLKILDLKRHLLGKDWPAEIRLLTVLACDGCAGVIATAKKNIKGPRVKKKLDLLAERIREWRGAVSVGKVRKGDFSEIFPLLKKHGNGFRRERVYPKLLNDFYDYPETAKDIEGKALSWLEGELPKFRAIVAKLAVKLQCRPAPDSIEKVMGKRFAVPRNRLIQTILQVRKILQKVAEKHWVRITPKYDVRVIETPKYLVPFMPTAAMSSFNTLTSKPFCVFFATTDPRGSPSTCLPELMQTIIHEEYGHCVNFMNSYKGYLKPLRLVEILGGTLDTPITEGLSFHREIEALHAFRHFEHAEQLGRDEKALVALMERYADLETFTDALEYVVRKWRVFRFLRAISDSRVNTGKQRYAGFVDWAAKKTGLPKKLIYDQTFFFQERPGYSPGYSMFGQRLAELQKKAFAKGISRLDFNTFVASTGFPARKLFERQIRQQFRL
jgi:hypothetical protein